MSGKLKVDNVHPFALLLLAIWARSRVIATCFSLLANLTEIVQNFKQGREIKSHKVVVVKKMHKFRNSVSLSRISNTPFLLVFYSYLLLGGIHEAVGMIAEGPVVLNTPSGRIRGERYLLADGSRGMRFLGIPYAEPPVGPLRFATPKQKRPWGNKTLDARAFGPMCHQPIENDAWDTVQTEVNLDALEHQLRKLLKVELGAEMYEEEEERLEDEVRKTGESVHRKKVEESRRKEDVLRQGSCHGHFTSCFEWDLDEPVYEDQEVENMEREETGGVRKGEDRKNEGDRMRPGGEVERKGEGEVENIEKVNENGMKVTGSVGDIVGKVTGSGGKVSENGGKVTGSGVNLTENGGNLTISGEVLRTSDWDDEINENKSVVGDDGSWNGSYNGSMADFSDDFSSDVSSSLDNDKENKVTHRKRRKHEERTRRRRRHEWNEDRRKRKQGNRRILKEGRKYEGEDRKNSTRQERDKGRREGWRKRRERWRKERDRENKKENSSNLRKERTRETKELRKQRHHNRNEEYINERYAKNNEENGSNLRKDKNRETKELRKQRHHNRKEEDRRKRYAKNNEKGENKGNKIKEGHEGKQTRKTKLYMKLKSMREYEMSEDCLTLNIYTPILEGGRRRGGSERGRGRGVNASLPLLLYIHGGSFYSNGGRIYPGEKLASLGVVVVTINYRLGPFGFLSTGDSSARGNWGLLDQKLALSWIRHHASYFGADTNNLLLMGNSAGAASVLLHLVSPLSKGLFNRAVALSGCSLAPWSLQTRPLHFAQRLAADVDCPQEPPKELVKCLRTTSAHRINQVYGEKNVQDGLWLAFAPVVEGESVVNAFLPYTPRKAMEMGKVARIPLMMTLTRDEVSIWFRNKPDNISLDDAEKWMDMLMRQKYPELHPSSLPSVMHAIRAAYLYTLGYHRNTTTTATTTMFEERDEFIYDPPLPSVTSMDSGTTTLPSSTTTSASSSPDMMVPIKTISDLISDLGLRVPCVEEAAILSEWTTLYLAEFSYASPDDVRVGNQKWIGSYHESDLQFVFGLPFLGLVNTLRGPQDTSVADSLMRILVTFAKSGVPDVGDGIEWPVYNKVHPVHLQLDANLTLGHNLVHQRLCFWKRLVPLLTRWPIKPPKDDPSGAFSLTPSFSITLATLLYLLFLHESPT